VAGALDLQSIGTVGFEPATPRNESGRRVLRSPWYCLESCRILPV